MGRYRPPMPPKAKYITPKGERALREELHYLWKEKRPQVTQAVSEAAALGDRSENAEYLYGKKQLREIDRRVRYLMKRLDEVVVVDRIPDDQGCVYFGAWVTLENEQGEQQRFRIVGADEFDLKKGWISIDSPLSRNLLKKRVDDEITWQREHSTGLWWIIDIHYEDPDNETAI